MKILTWLDGLKSTFLNRRGRGGKLSGRRRRPAGRQFAASDGKAKTSDHDYQAQSGTLTFAPGETTKTITIVVYGDTKKEPKETFYLDLFGNSSNSLFTKNRGLGTILNDD